MRRKSTEERENLLYRYIYTHIYVYIYVVRVVYIEREKESRNRGGGGEKKTWSRYLRCGLQESIFFH